MRRSVLYLSPLLLLLLAPFLLVVSAPLHTPAPQWSYVLHDILPTHLSETAELLAISVSLAILFGVSTAWLVSGFQFPLRASFRWSLVLPLALPTYISAITFASLFGPTGSLSRATRAGFDIMTLPGLGFVLALVLFPYIFLPARAAFSAGMSAHLDAARMLGGGALRRFFRVAVPLARPAIAGGALLVAMEVLNDYGAVKYYGVRTLTAGIFRSWGGLYDVGSALRLCGILLVFVLALSKMEGSIRRRAGHAAVHQPVVRVHLVGWRAFVATGWCMLLFFLAFALPVVAIALDAVRTVENAHFRQFLPALGNTLLVGTCAAVVTLLLAVVVAYADRSARGRRRLSDWTGIGYVVPGAVIALGVMSLAGHLTRLSGVVLIGSVALMVYAFAVRFLALATQPISAGLRQQPRSMDEASLLLGASRWRTFTQVNLPLLRPALIAAALLVLMEVVKELPLTLILRPFNFDTLSTKVFELARIEQWQDAALPALLIVLCGLVPVIVLDRLLDRPLSHRHAPDRRPR